MAPLESPEFKEKLQFFKRELVAGITTFFTVAYIVVVNPSILSTEGTGMSFSGTLTATVLLCFTMTLLMGLYARLPYAVAPGMGVNAFFTYTVILGQGIPWPTALGMVFWAGIFFLIISIFPIREAIARAMPMHLRSAAAGGIGLFLTLIGLKNMGFVVADSETLVKVGKLGWDVGLSGVGFVAILVLMRKKNPLAFLGGIFLVTALALAMNRVQVPEQVFSSPDFESVFLKMDVWGALKWSLLPTILSILFTDLFDSISTFVGVSQATGLVDKDGHPQRLKEGLVVDAFATLSGGLFGTSSGTAYIESAAGIEAGGRTGLTSVVTALCFLPCFFIAPLAGMVPAYATAPVLVIVGVMLFKSVLRVSLEKLEEAVPAFLTLVLIPFTFSITQGILVGFMSHVLLFCLVGRRREVHPWMYGIAGVCAVLFWIEHIR